MTPLAPRDLLVLAVLAEGPNHGYGLIKAAEDRSRSGVLLDPANLYRCLRRMKADGWIDEIESDQEDRRRIYRITTRGRSMLRQEVERLERLLTEVKPALAGRHAEPR